VGGKDTNGKDDGETKTMQKKKKGEKKKKKKNLPQTRLRIAAQSSAVTSPDSLHDAWPMAA
jgi:hypothetical protein